MIGKNWSLTLTQDLEQMKKENKELKTKQEKLTAIEECLAVMIIGFVVLMTIVVCAGTIN